MKGQIVFQFDSHGFHQRPDHEREAVKEFLTAHGIPPSRFMIGETSIKVRIGPEGGLWVDTWRAVVDDDGKRILCENCPACVRQERVGTPLVTAVPHVAGAFYGDELAEPWKPSGVTAEGLETGS